MARKPRSKRINVDVKARWKQILKTVSKEEVPISLLDAVNVNLIDGTTVTIDIVQLLSEGHDPDEIKDELNDRLKQMDEIIKDVDFFISIENVAKTVQPVTDDILKDLL
jgi:hypothetical protein